MVLSMSRWRLEDFLPASRLTVHCALRRLLGPVQGLEPIGAADLNTFERLIHRSSLVRLFSSHLGHLSTFRAFTYTFIPRLCLHFVPHNAFVAFTVLPPNYPTQPFHPTLCATMADKEFTYADVSGHSTKKDLFIVVHDKVYNASSFVDEHP